jgi:metallo-beta-lactamase class B
LILFTFLLAAVAAWNKPVEPVRITENLYYVGTNEMTSFLITTPQGHIVLDGGFEETAPIILANIRKLGFRPDDVKILLCSHAHYDHVGGLAALKSATGATFIANRRDAPQLARGGLGDPQFGDKYPFPPIRPDRLVGDLDTVTLGGVTLVAHNTPGHTPGCTTWTTKLGGHEIAFVGSPTVPSEYKLTPAIIAIAGSSACCTRCIPTSFSRRTAACSISRRS